MPVVCDVDVLAPATPGPPPAGDVDEELFVVIVTVPLLFVVVVTVVVVVVTEPSALVTALDVGAPVTDPAVVTEGDGFASLARHVDTPFTVPRTRPGPQVGFGLLFVPGVQAVDPSVAFVKYD